jgi:hypothetical protein
LLTVVTIQVIPIVAHLIGWQYAFLILAPGPLLGAVAMSTRTIAKEESHDNHRHAPHAARWADRAALTHGPTR